MFLASLVGWLLASLLRRSPPRGRDGGRTSELRRCQGSPFRRRQHGRAGCFGISLRCAGAVFFLVLAMAIDPWERKGHWKPVGPRIGYRGMPGAAIADWWKYGSTRKHLAAAEVFQNMLATGLLAASASPLAILHNARRLIRTLSVESDCRGGGRDRLPRSQCTSAGPVGQAPQPPGAAILIGTPYVVGGLDPAGIRRSAAGRQA